MATTFGKHDYLRDAMVNAALRNTPYTSPATVYMALFTTAPTNSTGGTEKTGNGYARVSVAFDAPSSGVTANSGAVNFPNATTDYPADCVAAAIMDAPSGGNILYFGPIVPVRPKAGDNVRFAAGEIDLAEQ